MSKSTNPGGNFLQFLIGGSLFCAGIFLFANQVTVQPQYTPFRPWGSWGGSSLLSFGTPGIGLLMLPLGLGVCLMFAGTYKRWANLLVWGSMGALLVGVLNSVRIAFVPATLWQLSITIVMIAAGGGLMFRSLGSEAEQQQHKPPAPPCDEQADLRAELAELRRRLDQQNRS
jgi:hypothetical protein